MLENGRDANQKSSIFELSIKPATLAVTSLIIGNVFKDFMAILFWKKCSPRSNHAYGVLDDSIGAEAVRLRVIAW